MSLPDIPENLHGVDFSEHVFDIHTGESTEQVIVCGSNAKIGFSDDLGRNWQLVDTPISKDIRLINSFTTSRGYHIFQSIGRQGPEDRSNPDNHAKLFVFDQNWNLISETQASDLHWHGTASIDQYSDTIMFGEYPNNSERYLPDFDTNPDKYLPGIRGPAIFRSHDDGISWDKIFEYKPLDVCHFHTVVADFYNPGIWWASTGDRDYESRVLMSQDDGNNWLDVTNPEPDVDLSKNGMSRKKAIHRYTDLITTESKLIWRTDDILGSLKDLNPDLGISDRAGSRIFTSPRASILESESIGYVGFPIRKFVDTGPGWIVLTESKKGYLGLRPSVYFLF